MTHGEGSGVGGADRHNDGDRVGGGGGGGPNFDRGVAPPAPSLNRRDRDNDDARNRDRGYGRDNNRERDGRDRDRYRDHHPREQGGPPSRRGDDYPTNNPQQQQRGHRGLGYDERSSRGRDRDDIPWERDRGMGRGSNTFVRGEVYNDRDRGRDRDDRRRDDMFSDRDRFDRDTNNMDSRGRGRGRQLDEEPSGSLGRGNGESNLSTGMGRGRGRGRGVSNKPAWMTSGSDGPVGQREDSSNNNKKDNETIQKLLAQARQLQQEQTKQDDQKQQRERDAQRTSRSTTSTSRSRDSPNRRSKSTQESEQEKLERQRKLEQEEAAKKAEEEQKRLEQLREEEEQRQLRALVGDLSDNEQMDDPNEGSSAAKKRKEDNSADDEGMFEFETEEECEERLARKRREERRKKLRKLEETNNNVVTKVKAEDDIVRVDQPRNAAGVIKSEVDDIEARAAAAAAAADTLSSVAGKMEEDNPNLEPTNNNEAEDDSGGDSFDIFASDNATPVPTAVTAASRKGNAANNAQECDDAEGYYKANMGEIITLPKEKRDDEYNVGTNETDRTARFRVLGIIGKGVFSSVIKCVEESDSNITGSSAAPPSGRVIAMKIIRNNEIMAKAAAKEMRILRMLCHQQPRSSISKAKKDGDNNSHNNGDDDEDPEERARRERENHNIVRLLDVDPAIASSFAAAKDNQYYSAPPPEFRSHCIFLFEFMPFNLREVLSKFGKNVGINLTAVRSYARQLLCALGHLERHRVVHADLKPDNILVSANFSTVKLADFGSAFFETDHDNDPTPYLVSRFYRPPEVILGLEYDRSVDLWSTSVTLAELFTGSVLFPGNTNNDMLVRFMDTMGPLSHKMVKRHALSYEKMGLQPQFEVGVTGGTYQLRKHDVDRVTGQPVCRLVNVLSAKPDARLAQLFLRASKGVGASERVDVMKFADFLNRCLALDPQRRFSVREALRHDFFMKKKKKEVDTDE